MTAEIPQEARGRCEDCGQTIMVSQDEFNGLELSCGCDKGRWVRVKKAIPESWAL